MKIVEYLYDSINLWPLLKVIFSQPALKFTLGHYYTASTVSPTRMYDETKFSKISPVRGLTVDF